MPKDICLSTFSTKESKGTIFSPSLGTCREHCPTHGKGPPHPAWSFCCGCCGLPAGPYSSALYQQHSQAPGPQGGSWGLAMGAVIACAEQITATAWLQVVGDVERDLPFFGESAENDLWQVPCLQGLADLLAVRRLLGCLWRRMHNDSGKQHTYSPFRQFPCQGRSLQTAFTALSKPSKWQLLEV